MVLKKEVVETRLKELSRVVAELGRHRNVTVEEIERDLSRRWILERGLIAAAGLILDIADHILAGHFGTYSDTYEGTLRGLHDQGVIPAELYERLQGLGGLRNLLVHRSRRSTLSSFTRASGRRWRCFPASPRQC